MLFFTGFTRSSSKILSKQDSQTKNSQRKIIENLHEVKKIGEQTSKLFESGNLNEFGQLMNYHWKKNLKDQRNFKRKLISTMKL